MKKRNAVLGTVLAAAVIGGAGIGVANASWDGACAQGGYHHGAHAGGSHGHGFAGSGRGMMKMMERLDLTKAQREQVWDILDSQRKAAREKLFALKDGRKALRAAVRSPDYDAGKVRQLADAQGKAIAELMVMRADTHHRIRAVLTPEQRTRLDSFRSGHHKGHGWR